MNVYPEIYVRELRELQAGSWCYAKIGETVAFCLKVDPAPEEGEEEGAGKREFQLLVPFGEVMPEGLSGPTVLEVSAEWKVLDVGRNFMLDLKLTGDSLHVGAISADDQRPSVVLVGKRRFLRVNRSSKGGQYRPAYVEMPSGTLTARLPDVPDAVVHYWDLYPVTPKPARVAYEMGALVSERGGEAPAKRKR